MKQYCCFSGNYKIDYGDTCYGNKNELVERR